MLARLPVGGVSSLAGAARGKKKATGGSFFNQDRVYFKGIPGLWTAMAYALIEDVMFGLLSREDIHDIIDSWVGDAMAFAIDVPCESFRRRLLILEKRYRQELDKIPKSIPERKRRYRACVNLSKRIGFQPVCFDFWNKLASTVSPSWYVRSVRGRKPKDF
jgi:hypothetical protein